MTRSSRHRHRIAVAFDASATVVLALALAGCASSTLPGAVGASRPQLLSSDSSGSASADAYRSLANRAAAAGRLNNDAALTARARAIAGRLAAQAGAFRADARRWRWQVDVFDVDALNAFATPGGRIGIFSGLVRRLDLNDDELATVIGHEMAHALREHARERRSIDEIASAVVAGVAVFGGRYGPAQGVAVDAGATLLVALPYSRQMESEADAIGLELMARAGYDPRRAVGVWRKLQAAQPDASPSSLLATHPGDERRMADIEALVGRVAGLPSLALLASGDAASVSHLRPEAADSAAPAPPAVLRLGPDTVQVERQARAAGCAAGAIGRLEDTGPGYAHYALACDGGAPWRYRCEFGRCRRIEGPRPAAP